MTPRERLDDFLTTAQGREWFDGVRGDDSILPHQWEGVVFGATARRFILGDSPGLGKTRQAIGWLDLVDARRAIIVVPAEVCDQFAGEVLTYASDRDTTNLAHMSPTHRHAALDEAVLGDGAIVINYELWRRDKELLAKLLQWQADTVIVDEAHMLKGSKTSNYRLVEHLVMADNVCPWCGSFTKGIYDPEWLALKKRTPLVCDECGGYPLAFVEEAKLNRVNDLDVVLSTKSVKNLMFTTGTPILNDPADIWTLLHLVDPPLFPKESEFRKMYCRYRHHSEKWEFRPSSMLALKYLIEPVYMARTKEQAGIKTPLQQVHIMAIEMERETYPDQWRVMQQISKEAQIRLSNGQRHTIMESITLILRKRQANVWPAGIQITDEDGEVIFDVGDDVDESIKLDRMIDKILTIHREGRRQAVFSQFKTPLVELEERLFRLGISTARLDGDTKEAERKRIKSNLDRNNGEAPLFDVVLVNYKTGGVGLNLTAVTATHILDEEWNPGKRDQAYGRSNRIGQTEENEVFVWRIKGTVDTYMARLISMKEDMIAGFEDATHQTTTGFAPRDLLHAMERGEL